MFNVVVHDTRLVVHMICVHVPFTLLARPLQYADCIIGCDHWHRARQQGAASQVESRLPTSSEIFSVFADSREV